MKHLDPFKAELNHLWLPQYPPDPKPISNLKRNSKELKRNR